MLQKKHARSYKDDSFVSLYPVIFIKVIRNYNVTKVTFNKFWDCSFTSLYLVSSDISLIRSLYNATEYISWKFPGLFVYFNTSSKLLVVAK